MKQLLSLLFAALGVHLIARWVHRKELLILLYHGIDDRVGPRLFNYRGKFMARRTFTKQLRYLQRHYTILPLDEALERLDRGTLPLHALALTFDDGYRNNAQAGGEVLAKLGIPATFFITTNFVEKKEPLWVDRLEYILDHDSRYQDYGVQELIALDAKKRLELKKIHPIERDKVLDALSNEAGVSFPNFKDDREQYAPMSWLEAARLCAAGHAIGAHTKSHPILSHLTREQAREEIEGSQAAIRASVSCESKVFCYPHGNPTDFTEETKALVRHAGFTAALSTIPGYNTAQTDRFALRRYSLDNFPTYPEFLLTITGVMSKLQQLRMKLGKFI